MTATTSEATTVQGAPRRLVEDAWRAMNRRYAIGTVLLLAALLLLWLIGNGPGAWRAAGSGVAPAARDATGGATAPGAPAGTAPAPPASTAKGPAASVAAGSGANGGAVSAPAGSGSKGPAASAPAAPLAKGPAAPAASGSAANGGAASAPGNGSPSANGAEAAVPKALPGAPVARLYFGADQAWPSGRVGPTLAPVLARLKAEPDTKALVSGFHDRRGSAERNAELALRRAQAVRRVLIREGVAADRIVLAKPQQMQGSGPDSEARRVEVTVAR